MRFRSNKQQQQEKTMTLREEYVLQSMHVICEEAKELFRLHPGLRELKVVRLKDGRAQVKMSKKDDLILFGSPPWGDSSSGTSALRRDSQAP
jgi:hypothetical protein